MRLERERRRKCEGATGSLRRPGFVRAADEMVRGSSTNGIHFCEFLLSRRRSVQALCIVKRKASSSPAGLSEVDGAAAFSPSSRQARLNVSADNGHSLL